MASKTFRVSEDILWDAKLIALGNDGTATYVRLLALASQRGLAQEDALEIRPIDAQIATGRGRSDYGYALIGKLGEAGIIGFKERRTGYPLVTFSGVRAQ